MTVFKQRKLEIIDKQIIIDEHFAHYDFFDILYLNNSHWYIVFTIHISVDTSESCDIIFRRRAFALLL